MANPLNLALTLSLNDRLVGPLRRALGLVDRNVKEAERSLEGMGRTGKEAAQALGQVGQQAGSIRGVTREMLALDRATRDAERSGSRLAGAFGQVRNLVRGVSGVVAGGAAFSHVVAAPLRRAADYDTSLRGLANTAYAGQSMDVRRAGMRSLDAAITGAVRAGGGSREEALTALQALVAAGVPIADATGLLPLITRSATAYGGSPEGMATLAKVALQNNFKASQLPEIIDRAGASGQIGGFELADMERWLPKMMAEGAGSGLVGMAGLQKMLALAQAAVTVTGTTDQAGNAAFNLLGKLNSNDTQQDLKKLGRGDLADMLLNARSRGLDSLDAFAELLNSEANSDPRMKRLRKEAAALPAGAPRGDNLMAQERILQGGIMGKLFQDRETRLAMIGYMNQPDLVRKVMESGTTAAGTSKANFDFISEGASYKYNQANFEALRAQTEAMNSANSAVSLLAVAQTDLYQKYPKFAEALEGAKTAVWGLAAAAGAAGAVNMLTGGGKVAGAVGGLLGVGGGTAAAGGLMARAGAAGLGGAIGLGIGTLINTGISGTKVGDTLGEIEAWVMDKVFRVDEAKEARDSMRLYEAAQALTSAANKLSGMPMTPFSPVPPMQLHLDGTEIYSWIDQLFEQQGRRR